MPETTTETERPALATARKRQAAADSILDACSRRFPAPAFEIVRDEKGTVWVRRVEDRRSIGLQPWLLRDNPLEKVLDRAARKLGMDARVNS